MLEGAHNHIRNYLSTNTRTRRTKVLKNKPFLKSHQNAPFLLNQTFLVQVGVTMFWSTNVNLLLLYIQNLSEKALQRDIWSKADYSPASATKDFRYSFEQVEYHIDETTGRQLSNYLNQKTSVDKFNSMKLTSRISNSNIRPNIFEKRYCLIDRAWTAQSEQFKASFTLVIRKTFCENLSVAKSHQKKVLGFRTVKKFSAQMFSSPATTLSKAKISLQTPKSIRN